jgi:hypothetical protein
MVLLASIGGYVLATDMGFSAYVYAEVRRNFLRDSLEGADDLVSQATTLYVGLSLAAIVLAALIIPIFAPVRLAPAMTAYFATIVLPLPWMLIRRVAAALDLYVAMETLECIRRAIFCALAATMLFGVSLFEFALACLAGWAVAAAAAWWLLRRHGFTLRLGSPRRIALFWSANRSGVLKSGKYAALEFFVYNLPRARRPRCVRPVQQGLAIRRRGLFGAGRGLLSPANARVLRRRCRCGGALSADNLGVLHGALGDRQRVAGGLWRTDLHPPACGIAFGCAARSGGDDPDARGIVAAKLVGRIPRCGEQI